MHPDIYKTNKVVRVRISGDGAKYNRTDSFVVMTFNILTGKMISVPTVSLIFII